MYKYYMPRMKFYNFVRMFLLPADLIVTIFSFYFYFIEGVQFVQSPYRYAVFAFFAIKAIQIIVNVISQIGLTTYSGYGFYGILTYFGLRIVYYTVAYFALIKPVFNRKLPDNINVELLTEIIVTSLMLSSIVIMGLVLLYYFMRKDVFYFCEPYQKKPIPIKERNYPWEYNEKYKPGRKPRMSPRKMRHIKERRLDIISDKEQAEDEISEADINEDL